MAIQATLKTVCGITIPLLLPSVFYPSLCYSGNGFYVDDGFGNLTPTDHHKLFYFKYGYPRYTPSLNPAQALPSLENLK